MRYRVGRKLKVAILNQDGHQVALCRYPHSPENMAQKICDLLNKDEHEQVETQEREKANLNIPVVSNLLPDKDILKPLFIDFFIYHNEANKNSKAVEDYFDTWYNWKELENSNLDEPLTKW